MDHNHFESSGPYWLHDVNIMRKAESEPTPPLSPLEGEDAPIVDPGATEEFNPVSWEERIWNHFPLFVNTVGILRGCSFWHLQLT